MSEAVAHEHREGRCGCLTSGKSNGHSREGSGGRRRSRGRRVRTAPAPFRGQIVQDVAVTVPLDPFMTLTGLAGYTGLSVKTLRRAVNDMPERALPSYRVGAAILVRRSEADAWLAQRRTVGRPSLVAAMRELGLA